MIGPILEKGAIRCQVLCQDNQLRRAQTPYITFQLCSEVQGNVTTHHILGDIIQRQRSIMLNLVK